LPNAVTRKLEELALIVQKTIKGIGGIGNIEAQQILSTGIICNWWRTVGTMPANEIPDRLTARNLDWHQNHYADPDPREGGAPFWLHTPFISLTAGAVERNSVLAKNITFPARDVALRFATNFGVQDGYLFYAYVFVLGRQSIPHPAFSEELRELNLYSAFSAFQLEGEVCAKIIVPPTQIEKAEFYEIAKVNAALNAGVLPTPSQSIPNSLYQSPESVANMRELLI
jgi:hypothetical protein